MRRALRPFSLSLVPATIAPPRRRAPTTSAPLGASSFLDGKPARPRAGFSFCCRTNGLSFVAQVMWFEKKWGLKRLSELVAHSPAITFAAPSYRVHPAWHFVATAHLSTDQVNYWNKYSDTLVRYSRYICVNRRDKYSLYSAVYQLRVCRFVSRQ